MTNLRFEIQGSADEPYVVVIERQANNLRATCDCPAGTNGLHCKHRLRLFKGDSTGIVGGDTKRVGEVPKLVEGTDVELAILTLELAEKEAELAKSGVLKAKKALVKAMSGRAQTGENA